MKFIGLLLACVLFIGSIASAQADDCHLSSISTEAHHDCETDLNVSQISNVDTETDTADHEHCSSRCIHHCIYIVPVSILDFSFPDSSTDQAYFFSQIQALLEAPFQPPRA